LILALATHSSYWRTGPFTWLTMLRLPPLAQGGWSRAGSMAGTEVGLLTLVPAFLAASWAALRMIEQRQGRRRQWCWGWAGFTWPLAGITALSLASLAAPPLSRSGASALPFQLLSLALVWFVYLFVVNEAPALARPLALVALIQGAAGVAQFVVQHDVGLAALGELPLDPEVRGVSVLMTGAGGQRWLRAYGLTGHPNLLGTLLAVVVLMLLPELQAARGWRRIALAAACGVGMVGGVATVSRAAWLGFALGLIVWGLSLRGERRNQRSELGVRSSDERGRWLAARVGLGVGVPVLVLLGFAFVYRDMILSRFLNLGTAIEARSLFERQRDMGIALRLVADHPWRGVGLGQYLAAARPFDLAARLVHNVPLLIAAELGLPGALLWLWLAAAPVVRAARDYRKGQVAMTGQLAPWVALVAISMFQMMPWISTGWRATTLFALTAGAWALAVEKYDRLDCTVDER
jgi:hypothetical protein